MQQSRRCNDNAAGESLHASPTSPSDRPTLNEVDGLRVNKEFRIDSEPDLDDKLEEVEARGLRRASGRR